MRGQVFRATVPVAATLVLAITTVWAEPSLERGAYLAEGVVACANCHVARDAAGAPRFELGMSGGGLFTDGPFRSYAANITPDPATGIGGWTREEIAAAIREGRRPDGTMIGPPMPVEFYRSMSDDDLDSIIDYVLAQPAIANEVPASSFDVPLPPSYGPPVGDVPTPSSEDSLSYGRYLVGIGHCMECHTPRTQTGRRREDVLGAGGRTFEGPWGTSVSRNLTPHGTGLRDWTDAEIATAIRTGVDRGGNPLKPPMAFGWYRNIDDADMDAIVAYLRSLPPIDAASL